MLSLPRAVPETAIFQGGDAEIGDWTDGAEDAILSISVEGSLCAAAPPPNASIKSSGHLPFPKRTGIFGRCGIGTGCVASACFDRDAAFALVLLSSFSSTTRVKSTTAVSLGFRSRNMPFGGSSLFLFSSSER